MNNPDFEIDAFVLEQILTNSEGEAVQFEQLMNLLDLNPRSSPERLEIALLNDKNQSYGLLVETPEPMDWERSELSISFAGKDDVIEELNNPVKIVGGSVNNSQWVEILLIESTDISDFTIEHRALTAEDGEEYHEYYRFQTGSTYNAGTLIRINNGEEPVVTTGEKEHTNLYANHNIETFPPDGTMIRIKDRDSRVLHNRVIFDDSVFTEKETTIIWNEDASKLCVFIKHGTQYFTQLENGIYRLGFRYKRNIGQEHPVLKRFGFSTDETATIEFSLPSFLPG